MKRLITTALLAACTAFTGANAANLLVNGSFEEQAQANGTWHVYDHFAGWSTVSGSGIELRDNVAGRAFDGLNFVELDAYSNSAMAQAVNTVRGAEYKLSFAYSGRAGVSAQSNPIEVLWDGALIDRVTASGIGLSQHDWHTFSYTVHGTGRDTLTFRAAGTNDSLGGSLDAVSLSAVPEPSTAMLLLGGVALVGDTVRRRRAA